MNSMLTIKSKHITLQSIWIYGIKESQNVLPETLKCYNISDLGNAKGYSQVF